ncbi:1126_t:CDS:2 [Funneliformis geosporum]|uniref:5781_t:CDS:1 n=1 Tax=Funneliformis geosporum TaxID=1117311 RepID=A0A9W4WJZ8_9GLOM|nr:1126_t:CDS:2 [Funneliformis geosporum]CAI2167240.1 5781_t:CDS:2 [Funneliformis geosporum]
MSKKLSITETSMFPIVHAEAPANEPEIEEAPEEPEDLKPQIEEECGETTACKPLKHHLEECTRRVEAGGTDETCAEELLHFMHCVDHCKHFSLPHNSEAEMPQSRSPKKEVKDAPKPNFELSGKLVAETNSYNGVVLKYFEPPEARKPTKRWRLYVFKGDKEIDILHIHRQSAYLFGRERKVADIPIDHPSCSSQHAVLQFRQASTTNNESGEKFSEIKPYMIDLDSTNKTFVNNNPIPPSRYYELKASDTIKFGFSSRDYVLIHDELDDGTLEL